MLIGVPADNKSNLYCVIVIDMDKISVFQEIKILYTLKMYQRYHQLFFTTATILEWKYLLLDDACKDIIIESFRFLTREQRAIIYGFVIMPNHMHLVWHIPEPYLLTEVKSALLSFTGHQFKKYLLTNNPQKLEKYRVNLKDRMYQFWERNPLSIEIFTDKVYFQKMRYVHQNPCADKWKLATTPDEYRYSSAYRREDGGYWDFLSIG